LPIGYDGAERPQMLAIVAAASELPGPVYVHCHHGKHRGPAAAAWIAMAGGDWPAERALAWLEQAQTSPSYRQLYRQVESFVRPTADELAGVDRSFPEISEVPMLVEQMVEIDRRWQRLEEAAEAAAASDAPLSCNAALDPAHLATLLAEQLRELGRTADAQSRPTDFRALLLESEEASAALARGLAGWKSAAASRFSVEHGLEQVAETCRACHARFRD